MEAINRQYSNIQFEGLLVNIGIVPSKDIVQEVLKNGKPLPLIEAIALIDTGSNRSCIDIEIVNKLGLFPTGIGEIIMPENRTQATIYDVGFCISIFDNAIEVQTPSIDFIGRKYNAIIGLDILSLCTLTYNGKEDSFSLSR